MTTLSGSGLATRFGLASPQALQHKRSVRLSPTASKVVAGRASSKDEGRSSKTPHLVLVTLAAVALTAVAPVSPAHAGLFGGGAKVERGAAAPEFPGNEGTRSKVGDNSSVRNAATSGTPLGEAASKTVADAVESGIDVNIDPLKTKISDISAFKDTLNPIKSD